MRIQQLTTLLHESEAENAKLAQLADALKEEIRRSARNESREKHMENMEYTKNVILKVCWMEKFNTCIIDMKFLLLQKRDIEMGKK